MIGVYAGLGITSGTVGRTEYAIQFGEHGERIVQADNEDFFFMGFHLMNDPQYHLYDTEEGPDEAHKDYNVRIDKNLLVRVIKEIAEGDELFLFYNLSSDTKTIAASKEGGEEPDEDVQKKRGRSSQDDSPKKVKKMKMGGSGGNAPALDVAIQQHYQPHDLQLHHPVPAAAAPDVAIQQHYQPHDLQLHHPVLVQENYPLYRFPVSPRSLCSSLSHNFSSSNKHTLGIYIIGPDTMRNIHKPSLRNPFEG